MSAALAVLLAAAAPQPALAPPHVATLTCGAATFTMTSRQGADRSGAYAPRDQRLQVTVAGRSRPVALDPTAIVTVEGAPVRNRFVNSWACVRSTRGAAYLSLTYACAVDPGFPHDCGGRKEWSRLLDTRGRRVDAGIPQDGPVNTRFLRRLGLLAAFEAGMQEVGVLD